MERIRSINFERINWCCEDRGISIEDLAADAHIAPQTLANALAGEPSLTFNQLRKMSKFFNRGVLFFLEPGAVQEKRVRSPQFRTLANQSPDLSPGMKALIERAGWQREVFVSLRDELDAAEELRFEPPRLRRQDPKRAAETARQWLGLGETNRFRSYRAAVEAKGVLVIRSMGYAGAWQIPRDSEIVGFSLYYDVCPVIVIRKQVSETRQSFTLMHELGHLLLHRSSFIDEDADMYSREGNERTANAFAGHLLVPDSLLDRIDDGERPNDVAEFDTWLDQFRDQWSVSGEVILRRLLDSGRLTQASYVAYRKWRKRLPAPAPSGGSRMYRHREPTHIFGEHFVRAVFDALHAQHISLSKASTYLDNLKIRDVRRLEEHVADL